MKIDRSAFTIDEFCSRNGFCRASYYNDRKRGRGPREMVIGGRVRITAAAEADWQREREAERAAVNALQPESKALIAPPACNALTGGDKIAASRPMPWQRSPPNRESAPIASDRVDDLWPEDRP